VLSLAFFLPFSDCVRLCSDEQANPEGGDEENKDEGTGQANGDSKTAAKKGGKKKKKKQDDSEDESDYVPESEGVRFLFFFLAFLVLYLIIILHLLSVRMMTTMTMMTMKVMPVLVATMMTRMIPTKMEKKVKIGKKWRRKPVKTTNEQLRKNVNKKRLDLLPRRSSARHNFLR
jgi:hypothetical protein